MTPRTMCGRAEREYRWTPRRRTLTATVDKHGPGRWSSVAWFRRRKEPAASGGRAGGREDLTHLEQFVRSRRGVEGFIEPKTTVTETTLLLVAWDGEWTRRRVTGPEAARQFGHRLAIPIYDVALVGYPRRMREFNARRKRPPEEQRPPEEYHLDEPF